MFLLSLCAPVASLFAWTFLRVFFFFPLPSVLLPLLFLSFSVSFSWKKLLRQPYLNRKKGTNKAQRQQTRKRSSCHCKLSLISQAVTPPAVALLATTQAGLLVRSSYASPTAWNARLPNDFSEVLATHKKTKASTSSRARGIVEVASIIAPAWMLCLLSPWSSKQLALGRCSSQQFPLRANSPQTGCSNATYAPVRLTYLLKFFCVLSLSPPATPLHHEKK